MADVTPWLYQPDGEVVERLEWMTDILTSFNAREQRVALRQYPRRVFEYGFGLVGAERRTAENLLHHWQAQLWALPIWMDSQLSASTLGGGTTAITCDTIYRDFRDGGLLGLFTSPTNFEAVTISTVGAGIVNLSEATTKVWPAGTTRIVPLRMARMLDEVQLRRFTGDSSSGVVRFEVQEDSAWPAATGGTAYRSFPVIEQAPNWVQDPEQTFLRKVARIDPGTGPAYFDEEGAGAVLQQSHRWLLDGRAEIDGFRRWLYARQGRLSAFWLPTFAQDFALTAPIGSSDTTIDVENCGYTTSIAQAIGRRDIRILLNNGTAYMRRITGSSVISAAVERLTISSALGAAVATNQVQAISYMDLVRQESDAIELAWWRHDVVEAALVMRGSQNDL